MNYIGKKVYRLNNLLIEEYIVNSFTDRMVYLKRINSIHKEIKIGKAEFDSKYMISKIPLLREQILRLGTLLEESLIEINEYELKVIMNKYKIK